MKKLLACDIDGTLLHKKIENGEATHVMYLEDTDAIKEFVSLGNKFVLCTGRTPKSVEKFLLDFPALQCSGAILAGGAAVYRKEDPFLFTALDSFFIPEEIALEIITYAYGQKNLTIHWCDGRINYSLQDRNLIRKHGTPPLITTIDAWAQNPKPLLVLILSSMEQDTEKAAEETSYINTRWGQYIEAHRNGIYIDISAKGFNKGSGIIRASQLLGGGYDCYAVGDGFNDVPMFQQAGQKKSYLLKSGEQQLLPMVKKSVDTVAQCIEDILKDK